MKDLSKVQQAASDLYDQGVSDGVASVSPANPTGITPEQETADIAAATAALNAQVEDLKKQIIAITTSKEDEEQLLASVEALVKQLAGLLTSPGVPAPVAPVPAA